MRHPKSTLAQVVERGGPLDYKRTARYVEDVARQLASLHNDGAVHRDVRPRTIVLTEVSSAFLKERQNVTLSEPLVPADIGDDETTTQYDAEAVDYMAPELALNGSKVDGRADIYSLGSVMYFLLTGQPPFPKGTVTERLLLHQHASPEPVGDFRSDVPRTLASICEKMMAKKAADRYVSAEGACCEISGMAPIGPLVLGAEC